MKTIHHISEDYNFASRKEYQGNHVSMDAVSGIFSPYFKGRELQLRLLQYRVEVNWNTIP